MFRKFAIITCLALMATLVVVKASAQDQDTVRITTIGPLEFPRFVVGPGTYELRFVNIPGSADIVEVRDHNGKGYGQFTVRPVIRLNPAEHLKVELQPEVGAPARVKDWFIAGATTGFEPIYPTAHKASWSAAGSGAGY